jgi:hypothetical protein
MDIERYTKIVHEQAIETLLWSEIVYVPEDEQDNPRWEDMDGRPFDDFYDAYEVNDPNGDFESQVRDFVASNWDDVKDLDPGDVGHNFVLSRNHHGTGFWDRGLGELGDRLHKGCEPYGDASLYLGDDGEVHISA